MNMKYFPFIAMGLVIALALYLHRYFPKTALDRVAEQVAEEVVKEEAGIDIKMT